MIWFANCSSVFWKFFSPIWFIRISKKSNKGVVVDFRDWPNALGYEKGGHYKFEMVVESQNHFNFFTRKWGMKGVIADPLAGMLSLRNDDFRFIRNFFRGSRVDRNGEHAQYILRNQIETGNEHEHDGGGKENSKSQ